MDHNEWIKRRKAIRARMHVVEQRLLDDEDECDCTPDLHITDDGPMIIIERGHERFCRITVDQNVAAMEAGLKIDRLRRQIKQGLETSGTALADGHPILANFHARRSLTLLTRCRDLAERHGLDVPERWDELAEVLEGLERATG